jgi:hypothetical protein
MQGICQVYDASNIELQEKKTDDGQIKNVYCR